MDAQQNIAKEIIAERARHVEKEFDHAYDATNTPDDWHDVIADYNGWARRMGALGSTDKARRRFIQIAAVAMAAVEALDASW